MKKFSIFLLMIIAFAGITSCEHDDDVVFIAQPDPEGIVFVNATAESYTLTNQTANNIAERFVWSDVDFDAPTTVTYELQGSSVSDFSTFTTIGTTGDNNLGVTVRQMMSLAMEAGLDNDPETEMPNTGDIFFRVRAYAGTDGSNGLNAVSEAMTLTVILPEATIEEEPAKLNLFLVGDATASGWTNTSTSNNYPLFRDTENENIYYYTGRLMAGNVKIIEQRGAWAPQYGGENGTLVYRPTEGDPDPSPIAVESEGYYTFTINIADLTYTLEAIDVSSATTYNSIGYIGSATPGGWDSDTDMVQSDFDPHIWYALDATLIEGEFFKFRANDDWADNWGVASDALSGTAAYGSPDNMSTSGGTFEIWFNDITGDYILIPVSE